MKNKEQGELYNNQVTDVVHGFMQVWNQFESTLSKELSQIPEEIQRTQSQREHQQNANYELFYRACSSIYPKGNITMGEFSTALSVPLSTGTRIADWLVDRGYIQRLPDVDDRRVVRVALTETGKDLFKVIDRYTRQRIEQSLSSLTAEERTILLALISKVVSKLKEADK
ncbi:MAG: MarR family transcriptional regulator [Dehalococcoidales bacterium]|nr:MarR family transcriptional regulator [Dehalococcoidales bacterium]